MPSKEYFWKVKVTLQSVMPRRNRGRKNPCVAGHGNQKIKSHVTRNEDETAARYESQTDSALESNSTAGSGSQSKEEAGSEAPSPLTTGKGKRHGDLLSHRFSPSEKVSELTLSNGLSSCHDSAVSSCDGVSSCSSPSLEAFSLESGCVDQKDNKSSFDLSDSSSCANPTSHEFADGIVYKGRLSRKNIRRRRQRAYKRFMLRQQREMANTSDQGTECQEADFATQETEAEVSEEVAKCTATPAVRNVDEGEIIAIINDNLQDLNGLENTRVVDCITSSTENGDDIVIHEILSSEGKETGSTSNIPSRVVGDESDMHEASDTPDSMQEEVLIDPSEKLELLEVLKAVDENEHDIAIYEVRSSTLADSEKDDENEVQTGDSSEVSEDTREEDCPVSEAVTEQLEVEKAVSHDAAETTGKAKYAFVNKK